MFSQISKMDVVYVSFETPKAPSGITTFVNVRRRAAAEMQREIASMVSTNKRMPRIQSFFLSS